MELKDLQVPYRVEAEETAESLSCGRSELAPPDVCDPVVEAFKKDVDRTLLRESLKLTPQQRSERFLRFMEMAYEVRRAGERHRTGM